MRMDFFVGAYAASPALKEWRPELEERFMAGLREMPEVAGLEHPFYGGIHRWDPEWFLQRVDRRWTYLLTCLPGTMQRMADEPKFGLASEDRGQRRQAVNFIRSACEAAGRMNDHLRKKAVVGVAIHSGPRPAPGVKVSRQAFADSLAEIGRLDWMGAQLMVEHCDAALRTHAPDKGFLTLDDEIWALNRSELDAGVLVNWGRSALEARHARGPVADIRRAGARLRGLMFSGVTHDHPFYGRWKDTHAPFAPAFGYDGEPDSVMTEEAVSECIYTARKQPLTFLGIKVQAQPHHAVPERLALVSSSLAILAGCLDGVRAA